MYTEFGIKKDLLELAKEVENEIKPQFEKIENILKFAIIPQSKPIFF